MIVEQIWTGNANRNFNYLVACAETGEAMAIDPLDHKKCLQLAQDRGWKITSILNTHEHGDHTGGNRAMIAATGAKLMAHYRARIDGIDQGLRAGEIICLGKSVEFKVLDTPGHTMTHVCLLAEADQPALFSGDTLFNAGVGNCHNGGHPEDLYQTFASQLSQLPDATLIYPGHDYLANNLRFTADREPGNEVAEKLLQQAKTQNPANALVTTIAQEKQINVFFRLSSPELISRLREEFPELSESPQPEEVFLRLRELRNAW